MRACLHRLRGFKNQVPISEEYAFSKIAEVDHQNHAMQSVTPCGSFFERKNRIDLAFQTDLGRADDVFRRFRHADAKHQLRKTGLRLQKVFDPRIRQHIASAPIDAVDHRRMRADDLGNKRDRNALPVRRVDKRAHVVQQFLLMNDQFRISFHRMLSFNRRSADSGSSLERTPTDAVM